MILNGEKFWNQICHLSDHEENVKKRAMEYILGVRNCTFSDIEYFINEHFFELNTEEATLKIDYSDLKSIPNRKRRLL